MAEAEKASTVRKFPRTVEIGEAVKAEQSLAIKDYVNTQTIQDPYQDLYNKEAAGNWQIIEPPYNPYSLARLPYENNVLLQCITAMVCNCDGHGYSLDFIGPDGQQESAEALNEKRVLELLLDRPNDDYSFMELRMRLRFDRETFGYGFIEVSRDKLGRISMMHHVPAHTMRRTARDQMPTKVETLLPRDGSDITSISKRFCRFVQLVNDKRVYFREFGDPRKIDCTTGKENKAVKNDDLATEIIQISGYHPTSPYGAPRWINQLPSILGSRQAELTNYDFFKENGIPAYAVLVSGGELTQESLDNIENQFTAIKGRKAVHRMAFMEAKGFEDAAPVDGQIPVPKIELKELRQAGSDAMFQKYEQDCESKTRSSFRLPSLFVGLSEDHTYATANASYEIAEGQVFAPERKAFDEMMNRMVLGSYNPKYWTFRSNAIKITDQEQVIAAVTAFQNTGALTPNIAILLANEVFNTDIPKVKEPWGNWPFQIVEQLATAGRLKGIDEIADKVEEVAGGVTGAQPAAVPAGTQNPGPKNKTPKDVTPASQKEKATKGDPYIRRRPNPNDPDGHKVMLKDDHREVVTDILMSLRDTLRRSQELEAA